MNLMTYFICYSYLRIFLIIFSAYYTKNQNVYELFILFYTLTYIYISQS